MASGDFAAALVDLEAARTYPKNLGEGKLSGAQENPIDYLAGVSLEALGRVAEARTVFERAAVGLSAPSSQLYYNDQPPETILYQGLARRKLGRETEAQDIFRRLIDYGVAHAEDPVAVDYFAVSLPDFLVFDDDLGRRNRIHCAFMEGLGWLGLGDRGKVEEALGRALALDASHAGAHLHRRLAGG